MGIVKKVQFWERITHVRQNTRVASSVSDQIGGLCVILLVTKEIIKGQNKKRLFILGCFGHVLLVMEPIGRNVAAHAAKNLFNN